MYCTTYLHRHRTYLQRINKIKRKRYKNKIKATAALRRSARVSCIRDFFEAHRDQIGFLVHTNIDRQETRLPSYSSTLYAISYIRIPILFWLPTGSPILIVFAFRAARLETDNKRRDMTRHSIARRDSKTFSFLLTLLALVNTYLRGTLR